MQFKPLDISLLSELAHAFNLAFQGYFVPINYTEAGMLDRISRARIDLNLSVGAFDEGQLVAFMLIGKGPQGGKPTAFNAGTGVIPTHRGQRLVDRMYAYCRPRWQASGLPRMSLEVITENARAISVYERVGLQRTRHLKAYKYDLAGKISQAPHPEIIQLTTMDLDKYRAWHPFEFSWDYLLEGIEALKKDYQYYEWHPRQTCEGYAIIHQSGRIAQAGVSNDSAEQWNAWLSILQSRFKQLSWVNIDVCAQALLESISTLGWTHIVDQYEMEGKS